MISDELTILLNSLGNTIDYVDEKFIVNPAPIPHNITLKIQEIIEVLGILNKCKLILYLFVININIYILKYIFKK
jgi:hypothetical protein